MSDFSFTITGADDAINALEALKGRVIAATRTGVAAGAHLIEAETKTRMNGRPGPNVVSGRLRGSVYVTGPFGSGPVWWATTAPTMIYARRIELGFDGTDSLGRVYHQPAFPYLEPGLNAARPKALAVMTTAWRAAIST